MSAVKVLVAGLVLAAASVPASAQVVYQRSGAPFGSAPLFSDGPSDDQGYGERPSFEIIPTPNPYAPAVRVVERCLYPNGWNVTDFSRDVNGIPPGIDHTCPQTGRVRARAGY